MPTKAQRCTRRVKSWRDRHINQRGFREGDLVLLFNSLKLFTGKLHSR